MISDIDKIVLQSLLGPMIDNRLEETGVYERLRTMKKFVDGVDAAFNLIENDPHDWSTRPCQTCRAVSLILGRSFGCSKKREGG